MIMMVGASLFLLMGLAKQDALRHMRVHDAKDAYIEKVRPSRSHGLWMEVRFANKEAQITGMHWYLLPWRDYEVIK